MSKFLRTFLHVALLSLCIAVPTRFSHAGARGEREQAAQKGFKAADANLNQTYQQLLDKLDAPSQERVREAQRAWVAFRDAQGKASFGLTSRGGIYSTDTFEIETRLDLTNARLEALKNMLKEVSPR